MSEQDQPQVRARVNVAYTASGKTTWDSTIEVTGLWNEWLERRTTSLSTDSWGLAEIRTHVLQQSDALVAALRERYGPREVETNDPSLLDKLTASVDDAKRKAGGAE